jgi:tetratricopeptide (TPR) repeat protein
MLGIEARAGDHNDSVSRVGSAVFSPFAPVRVSSSAVVLRRKQRSIARSLLVGALSVALAVPSPVVAAQPAASDVDMEDVKELYAQGRARFDTLDYQGAIDLWTKAFAQLPANEENRSIRNDLVYNIATAQEEAYKVDRDPTHLRQAIGLLRRYVDEYKALYKPTRQARAEVDKVKARIAELEARLAEAEAATQPAATPATPPDPRAEERRKAIAVKQLLREDPELSRQYRSGTSMIAGGSVALGLGAISLVVMLAYLMLRSAARVGDEITGEGPDDAAEKSATTGAAVSGGLGLGLIVTGAVLLPIGVGRRRRAKREAQERVVLHPYPPGLSVRF